MRQRKDSLYFFLVLLTGAAILALGLGKPFPARAQADNPNPPEQVVKLIFIHHSCGENWLADDYGDLGLALGGNNYFVSDTNYGWGPDSIGDRTDIVNWPEWFRGPNSDEYLGALYAESGQNSWYTRTLPDPGGENQIVMFKSCFPNSNLEGHPDDPPAPGGEDWTVSNAKYIYNDLLQYFITRPDKLFIVVTAPPVQDRTFADNARAFNNWLVHDWLAENNYPYANVAVFDFYNVLTHPDNHHWFHDGQVEHIVAREQNTAYYPSAGDDDHPNVEGSRKATEEFIPLLNVYYHRWQAGAPAQPPAAPPPAEEQPPAAPPAAPAVDLVDDFESGPPPGSSGWEPFWDEATETAIACQTEADVFHEGSASLHIDFSVAAGSWATCALLYDEIRNWQAGQGLSFYVHASQPGLSFDATVYGGTLETSTTYLHPVETTPEMVDGWVLVEIPWDQILRADWEEDAGTPFDPAVVTGMAFGFVGFEAEPNVNEIWVDDIRLMGAPPADIQAPPPEEEPSVPEATEEEEAEVEQPEEPEEEGEGGLGRFCPGSATLVVLALAGVIFARKRF